MPRVGASIANPDANPMPCPTQPPKFTSAKRTARAVLAFLLPLLLSCSRMRRMRRVRAEGRSRSPSPKRPWPKLT